MMPGLAQVNSMHVFECFYILFEQALIPVETPELEVAAGREDAELRAVKPDETEVERAASEIVDQHIARIMKVKHFLATGAQSETKRRGDGLVQQINRLE